MRRRRRPRRLGAVQRPPTAGFEPSRPGCPFTGASPRPSASARAGFFEAAWWRFTAPPGTVVDRLRIARYGYRFLDGADQPEGGVNQGGWVSEAYTEDGPIIAGFAREGCTMTPRAPDLCDWGSTDPSRRRSSSTSTPRRSPTRWRASAAAAAASGQRRGVPLAARDDPQRGRDDPRRRQRRRCSVDGPAARGRLAAAGRRAGRDRGRRERDQRRHGLARAARSPTPCSYTRPAPCGNVDAARLPLSGLADGAQTVARHRQGRRGQPDDLDPHRQRRRHAAVRAAAAAVGAHAGRRGRRRRLGRGRRPDLGRRRRRCPPRSPAAA